MLYWDILLFLNNQALALIYVNFKDMKNIANSLFWNEFTFSRQSEISRDRKIAILKFCDHDHLAIFFSSDYRRSPHYCEKNIDDQIDDRAIGDRSCLANDLSIIQ